MRSVRAGMITSRRVSVVVCALLMTVGSSIMATPSSAATGVQVFLGYGDNDPIRPAPTQFPTPWVGDPNVIFQGCQPAANCLYDSGAVRVQNNSGSAITVNSIVVHFGATCTYDIWPHDTSVPDGSNLIVTQTVSGEGNGCTPGSGQMDGSDIGPNGQNWAGNCTQSGVIPSVDVTINGVKTSYDDSGQILNTGGYDKGSYCNPPNNDRINESVQWTVIGTQPCPGAVLTLAPPTQTRVVHTPATIVATLKNSCGTPLEGTSVDFTWLSGPSAGHSGSRTTDANGDATAVYVSPITGTDVVQASVTGPGGTFASNTVEVIWILPPQTVRMTGRAYGVANFGSLLPITPTPDTGAVSTTSASTVGPKCILDIPGAINVSVVCAGVVTKTSPVPSSFARAYTAGVTVGAPAMPAIFLRAVQADSTSTCSGATGSTTIAYLSVAGNVLINTATTPAPNTPIDLGAVKIVLNEQLPVPGADKGLTVNAVHIKVLGTTLDIVVSSATSDIHNCPTA
jgi:hypothetical protein